MKIFDEEFVSQAQVGYLFAHHPSIARKWRKEFPKQNLKKLPKHNKKNRSVSEHVLIMNYVRRSYGNEHHA